MRFNKLMLGIALVVGQVIGTTASAAGDVEAQLGAAAEGAHRSSENIARNKYRHPVETLKWLGIRDDMTVVEIWPGGGGWYTEVLAPFLRERGTYYAANYDGKPGTYFFKNVTKFRTKLQEQPKVYDAVVMSELAPPEKMTIAPAGSADLVVTFRSLHNMINNGSQDQVFAAIYAALKPGGILGVVQHRGDADMPSAEWAKKGYVPEAEAIAIAKKAGFELAGKSEINANPKDTKRYKKGVWTLPPVLRGDGDKAPYLAIGESDRMTLKFKKPQ